MLAVAQQGYTAGVSICCAGLVYTCAVMLHIFLAIASWQEEVAAQVAAVETLQGKRQLDADAAAAALRRSEAESRDAAERCAAVEAAARAEAGVLQSQVCAHRL